MTDETIRDRGAGDPARRRRVRPGPRAGADRERAGADHARVEIHPRLSAQGVRRLREGEVERHGEGERDPGGNAGRLRTHRRVEGQAGGRHLLGRRVGTLREARGAEAPAEGRDLPRSVGGDPASIGKPRPIPLKDKDGFWVGTALEPYGLGYHPKKIQRLGIPEPNEWDDLLNPKLKGEVAQCAPTRSSSSNATYEVILSMYGEDKGWEWLRKRAANTGHFTARSRDVPNVVAKGEYAAGFAVPSYMASEEKLAGFDIRYVAPKNAFVTPEPMAILAGSRNPKAARA